MPESQDITIKSHLGIEAQGGAGTAVATVRQPTSFGIGVFRQVAETEPYRPQGYKYPTLVNYGRESATAPLTGQPSYQELTILLALVLGRPVSTQFATSGIYAHTFSPSSTAADDVVTLTIFQENLAFNQRVAYALLRTFALNMAQNAFSCSGEFMARRLEDATGSSASSVQTPATTPILGPQLDWYMDATSGGLGVTKWQRVMAATWSIGDRFNGIYPMNSALQTYAAHVEGEPSTDLTLTLANNAEARGLIATLRTGVTKFVQIKATGPSTGSVVSGAENFKFTLNMAVKVREGFDVGAQDGLSTIDVPFSLVHDSGWGKALQAIVVNGNAEFI